EDLSELFDDKRFVERCVDGHILKFSGLVIYDNIYIDTSKFTSLGWKSFRFEFSDFDNFTFVNNDRHSIRFHHVDAEEMVFIEKPSKRKKNNHITFYNCSIDKISLFGCKNSFSIGKSFVHEILIDDTSKVSYTDITDTTLTFFNFSNSAELGYIKLNNVIFNNPLSKRRIYDYIWLEAKKEEMSRSWNWKIVLQLWKYSSDYGRSFIRWIFTSSIVALTFGLSYQFMDFETNNRLLKATGPFLSRFYFSVVTFTTLGFGDITPISKTAVFFVMVEVIVGYIMLGALISILADKFARRS
ncbi:two pore domain potassium channel family protein, partial [bacterium]|nr:two pore domain potassium channel family protein [bacterium]